MAIKQRPGPGPPFQKESGKWTFYDYPNGVQTEAGEYATEDEAKGAWIKVQRIWIANKGGDGPINSVID
jgi:hypothetical protein